VQFLARKRSLKIVQRILLLLVSGLMPMMYALSLLLAAC
jgi:hypothetical protein